MKEYDVVVIGCGNGGIGAALALAAQGKKPLVLEQHNLPGGMATSFVRGRFEFDASIHALFYDLIFRNTWEKFGITEEFVKTPDNFTFGYADEEGNKVLKTYPLGMQDFMKAFAADYPECVGKMQELLGYCGEIATAGRYKDDPEALAKNCPHYEELMGKTAQQVLDDMECPMEIQSIVNQFWWYLGPSMEDFPFFRFANVILPFITQVTYYPKHTCHGYLAEFEKMIRTMGGDIWFNTKATEIVVENNKVTGVKTSQGDVIKTNHVICNCSPRIVLEEMVAKTDTTEELLNQQKDIHENFSFSIVYLGLNKSCEELGIKSHHIFLEETNDSEKTYAASGTFDGPYNLGLLCPNVSIPDYSPEGTAILSISVPMQGFALDGLTQKEYFKAKQRFANQAVEATGNLLNIDLKEYIEEIVIATPATLARYANARNGVLGYAIRHDDLGKMAEATARLNDNAIEGLSYVGQFTTGVGYQNNVIAMGVAGKVAASMKGEN
ncbi:MAG: FAD-dependent oxidoreductase [Eubacteriales bacterium]|nr:FAD-dependent oxidoreductase [Eubacteriales bacterium]